MKKAMLYIVALMFSAGVNAATFDFQAIADDPAGLGEYGAASMFFSDPSGISVTATAGGTSDTSVDLASIAGDYAYLDAGNAGLGACGALLVDQCDHPSDDNVEMGEFVTLTFGHEVTLTEFEMINGAHQAFDGDGTFELWIDGVKDLTLSSLANSFSGSWTGTEFKFLNTSSTEWDANDQFYIQSVTAVPVPAALFLFAPALLGFLGLRRKTTLAA